MNKTLKCAGIAGILSLLTTLPMIVLEIIKSFNKLEGWLVSLYLFVIILSLVLYIIFIWGFIIISEKYQNNLLKISSYIMIIASIIYNGYFILILFSPALDLIIYQILTMVIFGAISILLGIALLKLKPQFGSLATSAGVMDIVAGICFITVILSFFSLLLQIPLYIIASMILFKAAKETETAI